jgi:hypothetical protein
MRSRITLYTARCPVKRLAPSCNVVPINREPATAPDVWLCDGIRNYIEHLRLLLGAAIGKAKWCLTSSFGPQQAQ